MNSIQLYNMQKRRYIHYIGLLVGAGIMQGIIFRILVVLILWSYSRIIMVNNLGIIKNNTGKMWKMLEYSYYVYHSQCRSVIMKDFTIWISILVSNTHFCPYNYGPATCSYFSSFAYLHWYIRVHMLVWYGNKASWFFCIKY